MPWGWGVASISVGNNEIVAPNFMDVRGEATYFLSLHIKRYPNIILASYVLGILYFVEDLLWNFP